MQHMLSCVSICWQMLAWSWHSPIFYRQRRSLAYARMRWHPCFASISSHTEPHYLRCTWPTYASIGQHMKPHLDISAYASTSAHMRHGFKCKHLPLVIMSCHLTHISPSCSCPKPVPRRLRTRCRLLLVNRTDAIRSDSLRIKCFIK